MAPERSEPLLNDAVEISSDDSDEATVPPSGPKRPLVVDLESVLAEPTGNKEMPPDGSPVPSSDPRADESSQNISSFTTPQEDSDQRPEKSPLEEPSASSVQSTASQGNELSEIISGFTTENTADHSGNSSLPSSKSWADIVDEGIPPPGSPDIPKPQRKKSSSNRRRKPATIQETRILQRKATQPTKVTSCKPSGQSSDSLQAANEAMDVSEESRKHKDPP